MYRAVLTLPGAMAQKGFVTLLVVLVLLIGMTTMTLSLSRSGTLEQQIMANDSRAQDVQKASEAALDYALAWATTHSIPWVSDTVNCGTAPGCPPLPTTLAGSDGGTFIVAVQYAHHPASPDYIKITATATQSDNNSAASSSCYVKRDPLTSKVTQIPGTWKDF